MHNDEVYEIFQQVKDDYLSGITTDLCPKAFILGGQGAVGKGNINRRVIEKYPDCDFLEINGDNYRVEHPDYDVLKNDELNYSRATQIFSNVFTEGLIEEAIKLRVNVIVEGTMRNPDVPLATARRFRDAGYHVEAHSIAAPGEYSSINLLIRYAKEMDVQGFGRLADMSSHDRAVDGLPKSMDRLFQQRAVCGMTIYTMFAESVCQEYSLHGGSDWNYEVLPHEIIAKARKLQLDNTSFRELLIRRAEESLRILSPELQIQLRELIGKIQSPT